jgi:predicted Rossmann fold nucleotide-binding protein DprA/Smf involved in DNA uptake
LIDNIEAFNRCCEKRQKLPPRCKGHSKTLPPRISRNNRPTAAIPILLDGQLTLISPYDPSAGFNVGHAMQRNKLIYGLADASLVVNSDLNKGGSWAGAIEQLDKLKFVTVYVRSTGEPSAGLDALREKGAIPWPNPQDVESFNAAFDVALPLPPPAPQVGLEEQNKPVGYIVKQKRLFE